MRQQGQIIYDKDPDIYSYYEYKYQVEHGNLKQVLSLLDSFCGNLDPFSIGDVDSIYYDSIDRKMFTECLNGDARKSKFRIRGYGDGTYNQIHKKIKNLSAVSKYKSKIKPVRLHSLTAPLWSELEPEDPDCLEFAAIQNNAHSYGSLIPMLRVKYKRYRYRIYDYRITLDTDIEVQELSSFLNRSELITRSHIFPFHVLEIKTREERPDLPFLGVISLPQISCSKFMMGFNFLTGSQ